MFRVYFQHEQGIVLTFIPPIKAGSMKIAGKSSWNSRKHGDMSSRICGCALLEHRNLNI